MLHVSRQGLTSCPGCQTFIKVATPLSATICPFCNHAFAAQASAAQTSAPKVVTKGRALLAAALLGSSIAISACGGSPAPAYGIPPTEQPQEKPTNPDGGTADAPVTAPAYGIAPTPD